MITSNDVAQEYKAARRAGEPDSIRRLHHLLIGSLSPLLLRFWHMLPVDETYGRPSRYFAEQAGIKINHADNILSSLAALGLAKRKAVSIESGLHYEWWATYQGIDLASAKGKTVKLSPNMYWHECESCAGCDKCDGNGGWWIHDESDWMVEEKT